MAPFTPPLPLEIHTALESWEKDRLSAQGIDAEAFQWLLVLKPEKPFDLNESYFVTPLTDAELVRAAKAKGSDVLAKEIASRLGLYLWYDNVLFRGERVSLAVVR